MGLKDKLFTAGSPYSIANGTLPATNPLATDTSNLHYNPATNNVGYSVDGNTASNTAVTDYASYVDGITNPIPAPTKLDLNDPTSIATWRNTPGDGYLDNLPT